MGGVVAGDFPVDNGAGWLRGCSGTESGDVVDCTLEADTVTNGPAGVDMVVDVGFEIGGCVFAGEEAVVLVFFRRR